MKIINQSLRDRMKAAKAKIQEQRENECMFG